MDTNLVLNLPFDESDGSAKAYDYSQSRADGAVEGANFVPGKNGNAISFGGYDTCTVEDATITTLSQNFTILAWAQGATVETGSPKKMVWILNFSGLENYVEIPFDVTPGAWYSVALVRLGNAYTAYVNQQAVQTITKSGTLVGVSLNQDWYGGEYGKGLLDDVKIYTTALTVADLIDEHVAAKKVKYTVDGVDFANFGVYVSGSEGVLNRPKLKTPASVSWDNYHGDAVDLSHKFYESREITLSCFLKATSKVEFIRKLTAFEQAFDTVGTNRLVIDVHPTKPLIYEVYCKDAIEVTKDWDDALMVGTFKLKLVEPEPVKKVLKHISKGTGAQSDSCRITVATTKRLNIYWGDGKVTYDVEGSGTTNFHQYKEAGEYYPVVTGCIDEISFFDTNAIIVWEKI